MTPCGLVDVYWRFRAMYCLHRQVRKILSRVRVTLKLFFLLETVFIDHFTTRIETTSNYSAITNIHTSQITTIHAKSFLACCVFTSRYLVTALSVEILQLSALKSSLNGGSVPTITFLHGLPYRTDSVAPVVFLIAPRHAPRRRHRSFSYAGNVTRYPATGCITAFIRNLLPQQWTLFRDLYLTTGIHTTIPWRRR
jgi:hypothetical protein